MHGTVGYMPQNLAGNVCTSCQPSLYAEGEEGH